MTLADDIAQCDRETGLRGSFLDFVKLAWDQVFPSSPLVMNWHIPLICEHYEACYRGEIRELVVNLPPGGSKSSITSVLFPAWVWIRNPERTFIFAAYGQKLVRRDAELMLKLVQSDWWRRRWGDRFIVPTVPAVDLIKNSKTGWRLGTTPGGEVTGFHANYQIIDDPNKPEEITKVGLAGVQDWMSRTMATRWRRPPEVNSLIVIMQRLHCDDLSNSIIEGGATHVCLPAEFDPAERTVTKWGADPRTEPGELMDPNRLPADLIAKLKRVLGPINAAAQLQQKPVPEGGAVFKRENLRFWSTVRAPGRYNVLGDGQGEFHVVQRPPLFDQRVNSWDCAFKDEETSDYVAGQEWGRVGAYFYLLDQIHGHFDFAATVKQVKLLVARGRGSVTTILIEDKANGTAVISTLKSKIPGIVDVDPRGGKFSRASSCSGFFEAGDVYLPDPAMPGFEWVYAFITELLSFPRAKHDDQVDAATQALLYLLEHSSYLKAAMAVVRKQMGYVDT